MSNENFFDKMPPDITKILDIIKDHATQERSDRIGVTRLEIASRVFALLAERFMTKLVFNEKIARIAVMYADQLMIELKKPSGGS